MLEESKTKTEIIKTLSENVNANTNVYRIISGNKNNDTDKLDIYKQRTTSNHFREPRKTFKMLNSENRTVTDPIKVLKNPFDLLKHKESNTINFDIVEIQNHVKTKNNLKKRPS